MHCCTGFITCCKSYSCQCDMKRSGNMKQVQNSKVYNQEQFGMILEKQLKDLSQRKENQIQELFEQKEKLKSQIIKLQQKNKLNNQYIEQLLRKLQEQSSMLKIYQSKTEIFQTKNYDKIEKQQTPITLPKNNNKRLHEMETECEQILLKNTKLANDLVDKDKQNKWLHQNHRLEINKLQNLLSTLEEQLQTYKQSIATKDKKINQLLDQNRYLFEKIEIISNKPVKIQDPIVLHKIQHSAPSIQKIYIDRPIQKIVFVQKQKIVKQFIQPQRPLVTRIINCADQSQNCRCKDSDNGQNQKFEQLEQKFQITVQNYENLVGKYKDEREILAKQIRSRNSENSMLSKHIQLNKIANNTSVNKNKFYDVQVIVIKQEDSSQSEFSEKEKNFKKFEKNMPKKSAVNTKRR